MTSSESNNEFNFSMLTFRAKGTTIGKSSSGPNEAIVNQAVYHPDASALELMRKRVDGGAIPFFSLEFFPPRDRERTANLLAKLERLAQGGPLFCDVTWHSASNTVGGNETPSMTIVNKILKEIQLNAILHITCMGLSRKKLCSFLERAKELGIRNILALRGDKLEGTNACDFNFASDLIKFIRDKYGSYFTIGVAGYPSGHPEAASYQEDLLHLKEKIDAGADFIITQLFFDARTFIDFERDCRLLGITVPIIAGVLPIQTYDSLRHIAKLSGQAVPQHILEIVEPLKDNEGAIRRYGIHQAVEMCRLVIQSRSTIGIHFFTLNREISTVEILKQLGLWNQQSVQRPFAGCDTSPMATIEKDKGRGDMENKLALTKESPDKETSSLTIILSQAGADPERPSSV